jgi:phosphoribosylaminoimidazolecarboxamide formyltransferase/IMP cyclohydrolase
MRQTQLLRYGENPHQAAAFYSDLSLFEHNKGGVGSSQQHHGKELSYNNYLDADAAFATVCDFPEATCVIVKHTNPCGVATRDDDLLEAYRLAVRADPVSAFGGIVAFNRLVDEALAQEIRDFRSPTDGETRMFYEIVIAPGYTKGGLVKLKGKSKTLRILEAQPRPLGGCSLRQVAGGWLYQACASFSRDIIPTNHKIASDGGAFLHGKCCACPVTTFILPERTAVECQSVEDLADDKQSL